MIKFVTVEGPSSTPAVPIYIGLPQHTAIYSIAETYKFLAEKLGYQAATVSAAFKALAQVIKNQSELGRCTLLNGVVSSRISVTGSFDTSVGPWVKGRNTLAISGVTMDPFRYAFAGIIPENMTSGAHPLINSVFDETTEQYDIITGTDTISIAGSDLACDTTATDEGVWLRASDGTETKMTISSSDVQVVKAALASALTAGAYTLVLRTRSGMGSEYGVAEATRKVTVG